MFRWNINPSRAAGLESSTSIFWPISSKRTTVSFFFTPCLLLLLLTLCRHHLSAPALFALRALHCSPSCLSDALATPPLDGAPKQYSPKIQQLVNDITSLTLLEVSDLNELLKVKNTNKQKTGSENTKQRWLTNIQFCVFSSENAEHSGCGVDADGRDGRCPDRFSSSGKCFLILKTKQIVKHLVVYRNTAFKSYNSFYSNK